MVDYLTERYHLVIDAETGRQGQPEEPITVYQIETSRPAAVDEKGSSNQDTVRGE